MKNSSPSKSLSRMKVSSSSSSTSAVVVGSSTRDFHLLPPQIKQLTYTIIFDNNVQMHLTVPADISNQSFIERVKAQAKSMRIPNAENIVCLETQTKEEVIDYYLTQPNKAFSEISDSLSLQPVFSEPLPPSNKEHHLNIHDFTFIKCLGKGGTSEVFLVRNKESCKLFALKMIPKSHLSEYKRLEQLLRERKIMIDAASAPFIATLHACFESENHLNFLLEFYCGGELFFHLQNHKLTESEAKFFFVEIITCFEYLHQKKILYRDLKPENIVLDMEGHVILTDFGLSKIGMEEAELTDSFCGSPEYMAPEVLSRQGYNYSVDFYTLGAFLFELITGLPPFYASDTDTILQNIQHEELIVPDYVDADLAELLYALLDKNPSNRVDSFEEIKSCKWFNDVNWKEVIKMAIQPPIKIDIYSSYIHHEFREIPVPAPTARKTTQESLFSFFYYVNPHSLHLLHAPSEPALIASTPVPASTHASQSLQSSFARQIIGLQYNNQTLLSHVNGAIDKRIQQKKMHTSLMNSQTSTTLNGCQLSSVLNAIPQTTKQINSFAVSYDRKAQPQLRQSSLNHQDFNRDTSSSSSSRDVRNFHHQNSSQQLRHQQFPPSTKAAATDLQNLSSHLNTLKPSKTFNLLSSTTKNNNSSTRNALTDIAVQGSSSSNHNNHSLGKNYARNNHQATIEGNSHSSSYYFTSSNQTKQNNCEVNAYTDTIDLLPNSSRNATLNPKSVIDQQFLIQLASNSMNSSLSTHPHQQIVIANGNTSVIKAASSAFNNSKSLLHPHSSFLSSTTKAQTNTSVSQSQPVSASSKSSSVRQALDMDSLKTSQSLQSATTTSKPMDSAALIKNFLKSQLTVSTKSLLWEQPSLQSSHSNQSTKKSIQLQQQQQQQPHVNHHHQHQSSANGNGNSNGSRNQQQLLQQQHATSNSLDHKQRFFSPGCSPKTKTLFDSNKLSSLKRTVPHSVEPNTPTSPNYHITGGNAKTLPSSTHQSSQTTVKKHQHQLQSKPSTPSSGYVHTESLSSQEARKNQCQKNLFRGGGSISTTPSTTGLSNYVDASSYQSSETNDGAAVAPPSVPHASFISNEYNSRQNSNYTSVAASSLNGNQISRKSLEPHKLPQQKQQQQQQLHKKLSITEAMQPPKNNFIKFFEETTLKGKLLSEDKLAKRPNIIAQITAAANVKQQLHQQQQLRQQHPNGGTRPSLKESLTTFRVDSKTPTSYSDNLTKRHTLHGNN